MARMATRTSAGILLYRVTAGGLETLLAHPGGPFFAKRDAGSWSIPKGEPDGGEPLLDVARREFTEETGHPLPDGPLLELGSIVQKGGKVVHAWAVEGDLDPAVGALEHLRDGVAAEVGPDGGLPGDRPGRPGSTPPRRGSGSRRPRSRCWNASRRRWAVARARATRQGTGQASALGTDARIRSRSAVGISPTNRANTLPVPSRMTKYG